MAGRADLVGSAWRTVTESWPRVVQTWGAVDDFLRQHPELPAAARRNLEVWRARVVAAQRQRSPEARLHATLTTVRWLADECAAAASGDEVVAAQVGSWRQTADRIERALTLVEARRGLARRRMLARVVARTDELAAQAFEQLVADGRTPGGGATADRRSSE